MRQKRIQPYFILNAFPSVLRPLFPSSKALLQAVRPLLKRSARFLPPSNFRFSHLLNFLTSLFSDFRFSHLLNFLNSFLSSFRALPYAPCPRRLKSEIRNPKSKIRALLPTAPPPCTGSGRPRTSSAEWLWPDTQRSRCRSRGTGPHRFR